MRLDFLEPPVGLNAQRADQTQFQDGAFLVLHRLEVPRQRLDILQRRDMGFMHHEAPHPVLSGRDADAFGVKVDNQNLAGVDFAEIVGFMRAGVENPATGTHRGSRMAVTQGEVLVATVPNVSFGVRNLDDGRIIPVRGERIDGAMAHHHPQHPGRGIEPGSRRRDEVVERTFGSPWCTDHLDPRVDFQRLARRIQNMHMRRLAFQPGLAGVYAAGIERIVIGRQEVSRNRNARHDFARPKHGAPVDLVGFEDIPGDNNELTSLFLGDTAKVADPIKARGGPQGLRIRVQELARNAELPVAGVHEAGLHFPALCWGFVRKRRRVNTLLKNSLSFLKALF